MYNIYESLPPLPLSLSLPPTHPLCLSPPFPPLSARTGREPEASKRTQAHTNSREPEWDSGLGAGADNGDRGGARVGGDDVSAGGGRDLGCLTRGTRVLVRTRKVRTGRGCGGLGDMSMREGTILGGGSAPGLFWVELDALRVQNGPADKSRRNAQVSGGGAAEDELEKTEADVEDLWRLGHADVDAWEPAPARRASPALQQESFPAMVAATAADGRRAPPQWFLRYIQLHGSPPPPHFAPPHTIDLGSPLDFTPPKLAHGPPLRPDFAHTLHPPHRRLPPPAHTRDWGHYAPFPAVPYPPG
jgi:hypothetical protein